MAVYEALTLDGLTISGDPTATLILEQFQAPPPKAKPEWISAADSEWAALTRSPLHENREITLRIRVKQQTTMDLALDQIGNVRDKLRKASLTDAGIAMTWTPTNATRTITFDVLHGEITDLPIEASGDGYGWLLQTPVFTVVLTAKPYGYAANETLTSTFSLGPAPMVTMEVSSVPGDVPALARLIVGDTLAAHRRLIEWGIEQQNYVSPGTATPLILDSDSLVTSGFSGVQTTTTGMYDPNATGSNAVRVSPITTTTAMAGTGTQTHVGTFRVLARFASASPKTHKVRFAWHVGDGPYTNNAWTNLVDTNSEIELGLITIPSAAVGTQQWDGRVEAYDSTADSGAAPTTLDLDYLLLMPVAEGFGQARATYRYQPGVIVARDEFTGSGAGAGLTSRVAPLGGTWTTVGATGDFLFSDAAAPSTQERIQRATTADLTGGRTATLGLTSYTDTEVGVRIYRTTAALNGMTGLSIVARYVDANNYLILSVVPPSTLTLTRFVAGVATTMAQRTDYVTWANLWYRLRLIAFASGTVFATLLDDNGNVLASLVASHSTLATGGTLATGKPGINDTNIDTAAVTRLYDDFYAATPAAEPIVMYSGRTIEFRHDTVVRQDSGGTYYGRPPAYRGSRFLVNPGTSRVAVRTRRRDTYTTTADTFGEGTTLQVAYRPRYLVVPR